jgi:hypothetical protein
MDPIRLLCFLGAMEKRTRFGASAAEQSLAGHGFFSCLSRLGETRKVSSNSVPDGKRQKELGKLSVSQRTFRSVYFGFMIYSLEVLAATRQSASQQGKKAMDRSRHRNA